MLLGNVVVIYNFGKSLGKFLFVGSVILLEGNLGIGKIILV